MDIKMAQIFTCENCRKIITMNPRLKGNQRYCGDRQCQQARKTSWQKQKMATDPTYRNKQYQSMDRWRKHEPLHRYQKNYRINHPHYVEQNRTKQKGRNQLRASLKNIVKMDALSTQLPRTHNLYEMKSYKKDCYGKIVNMDTLIVKLSYLTDSQAFAMANSP